MAQYTQRSQPMHRHKKWIELTFGDTEISSSCQVVCEVHMEPHFASFVRERHMLRRSEPAYENDVSEKLSSSPSNVTNRPRKRKRLKKSFYRKKIRKPTAKVSKNQAEIKKTIDSKQNEEVPVTTVPDPLDKPLPEDCKEEMLPPEQDLLEETALDEPPEKRVKLETPPHQQFLEEMATDEPPEKRKRLEIPPLQQFLEETALDEPPEKFERLEVPTFLQFLEETAIDEPPEKRERLEIPPLQQTDINGTDSITYEIIIKDDPDNFEGEILPSVICDDIVVEIKREDADNEEAMDQANCSDQADRAVIDVKIETTDNVKEKQIENIFSECKIVPPSLKVVKVQSQTTDLPAPKAFMSFTKLLDSVLKENLISSDQRDMLAKFQVDSKFFMDGKQLLNPQPKMKSFALALYLVSHKAYDYILRTYKTSLPPLTAVKDWLVQAKGHSGFTRETLEVLNFMSKNREGEGIKKSPTYVCLVLKTIKLHNYCRSPSNRASSVKGNTTNPLEWSLATAESVLVLTAVAINASWKLPIGYFWDNVVKVSELANLVKVAIGILEEVHVAPVAISFESNDDNRRMCEELSGSHAPTVKEYFMSHSGIPIFMFPDPCDIIEQIDKDMKDIECYDNSRRVVSLKHLTKLIKYANIPSGPITLKKAIASQLCRKDFRSYKGAGAGTLTFLEHLQNVFEILSSRRSVQVQKSMEARPKTSEILGEIHRHAVMLRQAEMYIKSLKLKDSTDPLGLALDNFGSLRSFCTLIMTTLIMICKYWSIPFGKFIGNSTFFLSNLMPQCNGSRRPTANTFQRKYKAMLEENITKPLRHCSTKKNIYNFSVLKCKNPVDTINLTTVISNGNKLRIFAHDFWKLLRCETDEFTDEFVVYVSRYVTTILVCELQCETCISALRSQNANVSKKQKTRPKPEKPNKKLVVTKLEEPSSDVMDICEKSEEVFKTAVFYHDRQMKVKLCVPLLVSKVLRKFMDRPLFEGLRHHQFDTDRTCNHLIELTRAVGSCYLDLRISNWNRNVELTKEKELLQKKV